jgi:hypothetical protein
VLSAPHPLSRVSLLFLLLISQFLFFSPGGGQSVQGAMLLWPRLVCEYRSTVKLTLSAASQAVYVQVTGSPGSLLVSLFDVKWRFSALAGGVEGSKFCLFSVILPAKCVSSVSPRFHYRRLAFWFIPLAAILESLKVFFLIPSLTLPCSWVVMWLGLSQWDVNKGPGLGL